MRKISEIFKQSMKKQIKEMEEKSKGERPPSIPIYEQLQYYVKFKNELMEDGCFKTSTAQVYKDIKAAGLKMEPKSMLRKIERHSLEIFGKKLGRQMPRKDLPIIEAIKRST